MSKSKVSFIKKKSTSMILDLGLELFKNKDHFLFIKIMNLLILWQLKTGLPPHVATTCCKCGTSNGCSLIAVSPSFWAYNGAKMTG
jgi:hypothetical protein